MRTRRANSLDNPQGFTWRPDGSVYLAQAGVGGETEGIWTNAPSGNFGGYTAGVARIEAGCAVPVADGLLSAGIQFPIDHRFGVPGTDEIGEPRRGVGARKVRTSRSEFIVVSPVCDAE